MILEQIIEQENKLLAKNIIPEYIYLSYDDFLNLIKETGLSKFTNKFHMCKIVIQKNKKVLVT